MILTNVPQIAAQEGRFYDSGTNREEKNKNGRPDSYKKNSVPLVKNTKMDTKQISSKTTNNMKTVSLSRDTGLRVLKVIPSIVYGQAVVTMAKGGAESQTYQIFCEMLEAGIIPSTMTINNVIMELSKKGSYKVAISIVDQLSRYQVSVSSASLNSLFNACDKVRIFY